MKKNYFRKSIAILMALILVIWLPCGAMGDGTFEVEVINGTIGNGTETKATVAAGDSVSITANEPEEGKRFKEWTGVTGLTFTSGNATTTPATFIMPADAVTVTATYEPIPVTTYKLTVENGNGGGDYAENTPVTITANEPAQGEQFKEWTGVSGLTFSNGSATSTSATFAMPANAVTVTATYEPIPVTTYKLTVENGSGDGDYAENTPVTIIAKDPAQGERFKEWTGVSGLTFTNGDATSTSATFAMPANAVAVTATYEPIPVTTYKLTVENGNGGGDYAENTPVTIKANDPAQGERFKEWTGVSGLTFSNGSATSTSATFAMPAGNLTVTATYEPIPVTKYAVTVNLGSAKETEYAAGDTVTITANAPEQGKQFVAWTSDDVSFTKADAAETTFTMPAKPVTVTATYKDIPATATTYVVTVVDGDSSASYEENATVTIKAKAPESGKVFDKWTTNDGVTFANPNASTTTFKMPGKPVTVKANYKAVETQGSGGGNGGGSQGNSGSQSGNGSSGNSGSQGSSGSSGNSGSQSGSGNTQSNPPASGSSGSTTPAGAQTNTQTTDNREVLVVSDSSSSTSPEAARDPNKTYAPDGSEYNPSSGDTDKTGLTAVSGGAQGPSFNILDPVKTTDDTYKLVNRGTSSGTVSTSGSSGSGPAGAVTTATEDTKETTDETETDEKAAETIPTDNTYNISGGYNVMLIGVSENNTLSETWPLILQRGIVFEDFGQGENGAEDTEGLLQTGMDGIRKEEDPGYWDAPSAVANAEDMILQFGFYKFMESEKKETDMDVLVEAATRLAGEGLTMNIRGVPFFMEVQLAGTTEEIDILRQLITELEINGYGGNTVLIFAQTGKGAEKKPLVIIHPAIQAGMTVKAPMKTEDVLATVLSLSGQATEKQLEILNTLPGQNLLTTEELSGIVGLVPEPKTVEETTAEGTEKAGMEGETDGANKLQMPEGFGKNGTLDRNEQEKNRLTIERTKVTTNSNGQGSGTESLAPGSDVEKSEGPGGSGDAEVNSFGPGGAGDVEVNSEGPEGSGNADDSNSAGPGGAGTGEVSSDGPGHP